MRRMLAASCVFVLALGGCQTSTQTETKTAPAAAPAASPTDKTPERAMAGAMGDLSKALGAMAAAGAKAGPAIPYDALKPLLPEKLAGLEGSGVTGGTSAVGTMGASEASQEYAAEGKRLKVKIVDSPMAGKMAAAALGMAAMAMQETDALLEKPYTHGAHHGRIKIHKKQQRAEAVLVVKRIIVEVDAEGFEGAAGVQAALQGLDLDGLAKLLSPTSKRAPTTVPAQ